MIRFFTDTKVSRQLIAVLTVTVILGCNGEKSGSSASKRDNTKKNAPVSEKPRQDIQGEQGGTTVDNVVLLSPHVDGFQKLSPAYKRLAMIYFTVAVDVDHSYFAFRGSAHQLVRGVLMGILAAGNQVPAPIRKKIASYTNLFLLNHGMDNTVTNRPFEPQFIPGELAAAAQIAMDKGIDMGIHSIGNANLAANQIEQLEIMLKTLRPWLFDRKRAVKISSAGPSSLKSDVELAPRAPGMMAKMRSALPLMDEKTKDASQKLLAYFSNGNRARLAEYQEAWGKTASDVELLLDFERPEGAANSRDKITGALVLIRDPESTEKLQKLAAFTLDFERNMPFDDRFKRTVSELKKPILGAYHVLVGAGARSPFTKMSLQVPIAKGTRIEPTDKALIFTNLIETAHSLKNEDWIRAFSFDEETAVRRMKCAKQARFAQIALKTVLAPTSGKMSHTRKGPANKYLKELTGIIDEIRAESIALYWALDPKLDELKIVEDGECAKTIYDEFLSNAMEKVAEIGTFDPDSVSHKAAIILFKIVTDSGSAEVASKNGHYHARVVDYHAMRSTIGRFLKQVQRIKSTGDYALAKELLDKHLTRENPVWKKSVETRNQELSLPERIGFIYPVLKSSPNSKNEPPNIEIHYPKNLISRELEVERIARREGGFVAESQAVK